MQDAVFGQVLTAMVTPFDARGRIDEAATQRMAEHLLTHGSDGIVVCGTTGESPTLSFEEKVLLFRLVREVVGRRGKVIAGTGGNDTAASIALSMEAVRADVDGLLLVVPPYNKPSQEGLYQHFKAIAASAPNTACMLYNVPSRTAQNLEALTTLRLAHEVENIVAVKEASGNLFQSAEIFNGALDIPQGFFLYSGDDALTLPMLAVGGCGVVSVTAHLVGNEMKAMHSAFFGGRLQEAARINAQMLPVVRACFQPTTPSPVPLKAALAMMGLCKAHVRLPLVEVDDRERETVQAMLHQQGML